MSEMRKELQLLRLRNEEAELDQALLRSQKALAVGLLEAEKAATPRKFHKLVVDLLAARGQLTVRGFIGRAQHQPCSAHWAHCTAGLSAVRVPDFRLVSYAHMLPSLTALPRCLPQPQPSSCLRCAEFTESWMDKTLSRQQLWEKVFTEGPGMAQCVARHGRVTGCICTSLPKAGVCMLCDTCMQPCNAPHVH